MGQVRVAGWQAAPRVTLVLPEEGSMGWVDAAYWAAQLEAWGIPATRQSSAPKWLECLLPTCSSENSRLISASMDLSIRPFLPSRFHRAKRHCFQRPDYRIPSRAGGVPTRDDQGPV